MSGCLITNMSIHIGINHVLCRAGEMGKSVAEVLPVLRRIHIKKRHGSWFIVDDPVQSKNALLMRYETGDHRTVPGEHYIQRHIRLPFYANHLMPLFHWL